MFGITRGRLVGGIAVLASLGIALGLTYGVDEDEAEATQVTVRTGTYQPQAVFEQYHRTQKLMELLNELQGEAEVAQREGNQQKMMELQMRFHQGEQEVMNAFMADLDLALPKLASEANVDLIALEIVYSADHVGEPTDLTRQLIQKINADAPKPADEE